MPTQADDFLCEVFMDKYSPGHCPFPGSVVRHRGYRGIRLRMVLCGGHAGLFKGWEVKPLEEYRQAHGLIADAGVIGKRQIPAPYFTNFVESARNAETTTERNMWIAMHRAARTFAEFMYWQGHYAKYPLDLNRQTRDGARGHWDDAKEHAEGMYATYTREDHDKEERELPDYFLHSIQCLAAELLIHRPN
ncbi:hypothetical protein AB0E21_05065 [Streptomyces sp. NPDC047967]|uniref:hypothetical protein n=1 Tax=Streptomyces sp. NPDC047967 TaxID=3154924 RepID=UPI0033E34CF5